MTSMYDAIQQVLDSPPKKYTKEEAQAMLRKYGVLNADNSVTEEYSHIFVRKEEKEDVRK